jgi:hypothetical protein
MIEIFVELRDVFIAVLVALIGLGGTFAVQRQLAVRNAVRTFKSSFAPEIAAISNDSYAIDTFLNAFQRHSAAVDNVRPFLSRRYQRKLQSAWNDYCGKGTGLGLGEEQYVQASSAMIYTVNKEMFDQFKQRFTVLHGCLDSLL